MKTGINTLVDLDVPFQKLLRMIAAAGFTNYSLSHDVAHSGYHLPEGRAKIGKLAETLGIRLTYIHCPLAGYHDLSSLDPQVRKLTIETCAMSLKACTELGGESVVVHACGRQSVPGDEFEETVKAGLESVLELYGRASEYGITLCVENLPADRDWHRVSRRIMAETEGTGIKLCFDPCHATIGDEDPLELVRWMAPRVAALHLSDTMGEFDSHLIPGDGRVDFQGVARELAAASYSGVVDLECSLWMLRLRKEKGSSHPGDTVPCSTEHYLEKAHAAAVRIGEQIEQARREPT